MGVFGETTLPVYSASLDTTLIGIEQRFPNWEIGENILCEPHTLSRNCQLLIHSGIGPQSKLGRFPEFVFERDFDPDNFIPAAEQVLTFYPPQLTGRRVMMMITPGWELNGAGGIRAFINHLVNGIRERQDIHSPAITAFMTIPRRSPRYDLHYLDAINTSFDKHGALFIPLNERIQAPDRMNDLIRYDATMSQAILVH